METTVSIRLPASSKDFIEARVLARTTSVHSESSGYTRGIVVLLVETDGVLAAIKGYIWNVPEMAVAPENSKVRFKTGYHGDVTEMEIVEPIPADTAQQDQ